MVDVICQSVCVTRLSHLSGHVTIHITMTALGNIMSQAVFAVTLGKKATIHQAAKMLASSKHVLYPGFNHQC